MLDTAYRILAELQRRIDAIKGGEGSGNFGHAGRPGEVGGSGPGGGGSTTNTGENARVGRTSTNADVWRINNAKYLTDYADIAVRKDGGEVLATTRPAMHSDIVQSIHPDENVDSYVRFRVRNGALQSDTTTAGVVIRNADDNIEAVNAIYRGLNHLVARGLPTNTPVVITQGQYGEDVYTTAKMISLDFIKSYDEYRARLWSAARRLFNGGRDANFVSTFIRSIDQQLTEAWNEGADDVGVAPDEMTPDDMAILEAIINNETEFIERIADDIQADKEAGMTQDDFESKYSARIDLWANRYTETVNRAHMQFGSKQRMEWQLGETEEHCETCSKLDGMVAFGYEWDEAHLHPQMPPNEQLACEGWRCDCRLTPTDRRRTPRALDKLTQIVTSSHL